MLQFGLRRTYHARMFGVSYRCPDRKVLKLDLSVHKNGLFRAFRYDIVQRTKLAQTERSTEHSTQRDAQWPEL